ncbi:RluA family pseudouridine synthase [Psychroserpens damuponensis]|uniref:RluA family pseudouridine synthase n=1 Tax=Psychroserpens damuponensis TaxID=943936 RepID=UPI0005911E2A|nr:RluA family pseudouridine synthase [Psychroserpens damuponensis]
MNITKTHIVPQQSSPIRLQEYGVGIFDATITKSALKKALKKQYITVNGVVATTATYIKGGECIRITISEENTHNKQFILKLNVLFEDDYLAVIHKPAGVLVSGNSFKTIANALVRSIKKSTLPDATKPQPVHRLDFPTTGILLVGKTQSSIRALNKLFEDKAIKKTYYAVTIGNMKPKGHITFNIDDKPSQTYYKVCQSVVSKRFETLNLVRLEPQTGRRHQLRKHLSQIEHPILGDKDYGVKPLILNGKGLYLHAYALLFTHPFTKDVMFLKDELPKRFLKIFKPID